MDTTERQNPIGETQNSPKLSARIGSVLNEARQEKRLHQQEANKGYIPGQDIEYEDREYRPMSPFLHNVLNSIHGLNERRHTRRNRSEERPEPAEPLSVRVRNVVLLKFNTIAANATSKAQGLASSYNNATESLSNIHPGDVFSFGRTARRHVLERLHNSVGVLSNNINEFFEPLQTESSFQINRQVRRHVRSKLRMDEITNDDLSSLTELCEYHIAFVSQIDNPHTRMFYHDQFIHHVCSLAHIPRQKVVETLDNSIGYVRTGPKVEL